MAEAKKTDKKEFSFSLVITTDCGNWKKGDRVTDADDIRQILKDYTYGCFVKVRG